MFGLFKRKQPHFPSFAADYLSPLWFRDDLSAFEYACGMECPLQEGTVLPAVILDARVFLGAPSAITIHHDGHQSVWIRVASSDGGFIASAATSGSRGPVLQPGRLVAWRAMRYHPQAILRTPVRDKRTGWVGLIEGTLKPEYRNGGWVGHERFSS